MRSNWHWMILAAVVATSGCARGITSTPGDAPNLEKWVEDVRARPAPPLEPLPVMQQFETFEYAAQTLRDPFSNAWSNADAGGLRPARTGARKHWSSTRWTAWTWSVRSERGQVWWHW